jgi:PAS domain S-box-containing protein
MPMSSETSNDAARRLAAAASSDGVIITQDPMGRITSSNRAAEQIVGHSSTEAVGQAIRLIVPPDLQGEEDEMRRRLKTGETVEHYDTVRIRKKPAPISRSSTERSGLTVRCGG